jgi:hypothetical protein
VLRKQGVGAPVSAVIIYKCSDYTVIILKEKIFKIDNKNKVLKVNSLFLF